MKARTPTVSGRRPLWLPYLVFAVFAALLGAGLALDEFRSVLVNAANICFECIGIG